ncbi:uncharacterized protein LOC132277054 isoform X2 [Cornus florida]|uniref:uncharacterized protein LOC132277054 isoform X2 n=1 Tax=Cornus florida TaxID=4283 RepID=UPI00289885BD|nr:uncharacterized protein LOC132277054 isoform X2 [Cornus florida]
MASIPSQSRPKSDPSNSISSEPVENKTAEKDLSWYLPLYKAAIRGDWESARRFFEIDPDAITAKITKTFDTVLLVAATGHSIHFLEKLVELMSPDALALANTGGDTALHVISGVGNIEAAKLLVKKNPDLPNKWNNVKQLPLHFAAMVGHRNMILCLLTITREEMEPKPFENEPGSMLMSSLITSGLYDVALHLLQRYPNLARGHPSPLIALAQKPSAFPSGSRLNCWQQLIYARVPAKLENFSDRQSGGDTENPADYSQVCVQMSCCSQFFGGNHSLSVPQIKHIRATKLMHHQALELIKCFCTEVISLDNKKASLILRKPFLLGVEFGIHELVEEIVESFPAAISFGDKENHVLFHLAVINRHENVFNLVYQMGKYTQFLSMFTDKSENNILHLAGNLAPKPKLNLVSGAALQMQRELQWFKEVEKYVLPPHKEVMNSKGKTPAMVFTEAHNELVKEGEKWMKETATSCTVAAALIATVVFAAAITVPGGNNSDSGIPIFSKEKGFIIFAISDAISLFSSLSSILMFLSILTSRYAEVDFLYALPKRLIIGLVTLFLSITFLMITFGVTIFLVFGHKKAWVLIPVAAMACLPITLFISLQFPLLVDMIKSTYSPGIFRKQSERILQ